MKTKIFLLTGLLALFLTSQELHAQMKFGVHAGINMENQAELGELWNNGEILPGFMIGGTLEYLFGQRLSLQSELNYQLKGERAESDFEGSARIVRREFNYVSIPLLIKGSFDKELNLGDKWKVTGFTGPYFGYLTSANADIKAGGSSTNVSIANQAEKADFGIIFGGGVVYRVNEKGSIVAEIRYEMGLNQIDRLDSDLRNKGFGLTLGYRF